VTAVGGEAQRAAAVTEAVHTLRAGGYALVVVDGLGNAPVNSLILGRRMAFASGAFALARLADAPLVPLAVRWHGPAVEIVAGPAIAPEQETAMAAALAGWLEQYLREHPSELSFGLSQRLGRGGHVRVGS
jgi:lauroyl/myristoyl acyltransferase